MADTNTIFSSKLINLDRLGEFWAKAKAYIDTADSELTGALNDHKSAYGEFKNGYDAWKAGIDEWKTNTEAWKGPVDTHIATGDIHVTAKQKEDWQAATDAINAFLDETATKDEVIDKLGHYLIVI